MARLVLVIQGYIIFIPMDAGIIAYSAQKNLFDRLEIVSNNIANANTTGFKADLAVYLQPSGTVNGRPNPLPRLQTAVDTSQGGLRTTERPLDVALQGDKSYFLVDTPLGERYTKNGSFLAGPDGTLVTQEGYTVGGGVSFQPEDTEIKIGEDGTVTARSVTGVREERGTISVVRFDDASQLQKTGTNYFTANGGADTAIPGVDYRLSQGMVEDSNVNQVLQLTELIDISRSVQNLAKIIQDQSSLVRTAVQRITARTT